MIKNFINSDELIINGNNITSLLGDCRTTVNFDLMPNIEETTERVIGEYGEKLVDYNAQNRDFNSSMAIVVKNITSDKIDKSNSHSFKYSIINQILGDDGFEEEVVIRMKSIRNMVFLGRIKNIVFHMVNRNFVILDIDIDVLPFNFVLHEDSNMVIEAAISKEVIKGAIETGNMYQEISNIGVIKYDY